MDANRVIAQESVEMKRRKYRLGHHLRCCEWGSVQRIFRIKRDMKTDVGKNDCPENKYEYLLTERKNWYILYYSKE